MYRCVEYLGSLGVGSGSLGFPGLVALDWGPEGFLDVGRYRREDKQTWRHGDRGSS